MTAANELLRELASHERDLSHGSCRHRSGQQLCPALDEETSPRDHYGIRWGGICVRCQVRIPMGTWLCDGCHARACGCDALRVRKLRYDLQRAQSRKLLSPLQRAARHARRRVDQQAISEY